MGLIADVRAEKKLSRLLELMVEGLRRNANRTDFRINMDYYALIRPETEYGEKRCFGCAATCALQELFGSPLSVDVLENHRSDYGASDILRSLGSADEICRFEYHIDQLRRGHFTAAMYWLCHDCGDFARMCKMENVIQALPKFELETHNWQSQLPIVEQCIEVLRNNGF